MIPILNFYNYTSYRSKVINVMSIADIVLES